MIVRRKTKARRKALADGDDAPKTSRPKLTEPLGRTEVAEGLRKAAIGYFCKKRYAGVVEIGVKRWGARRADLVFINHRGEIIIGEVKSCIADYRADSKMHEYLPHCNRLYLVIRNKEWARIKLKEYPIPDGVGVLVLEPGSGLCRVLKKAKFRMLDKDVQLEMFIRMAWASAPHSRKKGTKRRRVYLE